MVARAHAVEEKLPVPPAKDSVAASEVSLYRNVLKIKNDHALEALGIAFYDAHTTIQWCYNGDTYFHAASTIKLAVLLMVPVFWEHRVALLLLTVVVASIGSHMPSRFRHRLQRSARNARPHGRWRRPRGCTSAARGIEKDDPLTVNGVKLAVAGKRAQLNP